MNPSFCVAGIVVIVGVISFCLCRCICRCICRRRSRREKNPSFLPRTIAKFLDAMQKEKPVKFTSQQLKTATKDFSIVLGSGGFGTVYKGKLKKGTTVAVKVLNGTTDKSIKEQFMAEVGAMGRTHHINLIKLHGYCFESSLRALVYEFMVNGSLDKHLYKTKKRSDLGFLKLHEIAVGTARGIAYLHEDCPQRIVHYDIKPANILLDSKFCAKVADFGLAKLCNRDNSYMTMTGGRGTPGYAAPELWMPHPVSYKCDVYSFGMLLFEIIGRRKNIDVTLGDIQQWFPIWAWDKYEKREMSDLMRGCMIKESHGELVERMLKVAFWCVQYKHRSRPMMSVVVKMLEGALEVPQPINPFTHMFPGDNDAGDSDSVSQMSWNGGVSDWSSSAGSRPPRSNRSPEMTV